MSAPDLIIRFFQRLPQALLLNSQFFHTLFDSSFYFRGGSRYVFLKQIFRFFADLLQFSFSLGAEFRSGVSRVDHLAVRFLCGLFCRIQFVLRGGAF